MFWGKNMREFIKRKKKLIIDILLILAAFIVVDVISMLVLAAFNVISFDGGINFNVGIFESFKNSWYGWIIFILFQSILTILLCIIPGVSMAFIILCTNLYPIPWQAFLISFISVMVSSVVMYLIGKFGGYKLCVRILGEEECEKSLSLLTNKSKVYFPLMMMFPVFPDDALIMIAGTLKMKMKWFLPAIIIGRGIGILTIVFGFSLIPFNDFTTVYDWLVFITVCIVWVFTVFHFANKLSRKLEAKDEKSE